MTAKMLLYTPKTNKSLNNSGVMVSVPSTSSRNMSRELLEEFLVAYRNSPCLWKIKSGDYLNKELKAEAYRQLEAICQKEHPDANRDFVSKKINSLRGSFRREYRRVITESNYVPQLWFYELLHFTAEQENDLGEMQIAKSEMKISNYNDSASTVATDYASSDYCFVSGPDDEKHFFKAENYAHIQHVNGETMHSNLSENNDTVSSMICTTLEDAGEENAHTNDDVTTTIEIPSDETDAATCYETDADGFVAQLVEIQDDTTSVIALVDANDDVMATETLDEQTPVSTVVPVTKRRRIISNGKSGHTKGSRMNFSRINRVSPTAHKATLLGGGCVTIDDTSPIASTSMASGIDGAGDGTATMYSSNIPTIRQSTEDTQATATVISGTVGNGYHSVGSGGGVFDEFSAYGCCVAAKLRRMEPHQRLYAENIINQTLFLGVMQQLQPPSMDDMMSNIGIRIIKREILDDDE